MPLTGTGRAQAVAAGEALRRLRGSRPWALVLTSPLGRAAQTAHLAGLAAEPDERLREWDYGRYEGITTAEIHRDRPGWSLWRDGCPEGERAVDVSRRVDEVLTGSVASALGRGDALLVAHSHLLRVAVARWLELDAEHGRLFVLDPAHLGILGHEHGGPAVLGWNLGPDLDPAPARSPNEFAQPENTT